MLVLCGFSLSNYYNKVKMALLEKGIPFTEEVVKTGSKDEAVLASTPLGKIPFIRTEHGTLCESQAIMEYLEDRYPEPRLTPADPWEAAKVRELVVFIDLHLELVVRELYPQAFFGGTVSDSNKARVRTLLEKTNAGRLRGLGQPAAGRHGNQDRLRRRPARGQRHRLEGLQQAGRRATERAEGHGGPQGRPGPPGGDARDLNPGAAIQAGTAPGLPCAAAAPAAVTSLR